MFETLFHADWSKDERKRWVASAKKEPRGWKVSVPDQVAPTEIFLRQIVAAGKETRTLAGFDFPIGVPAAFAKAAKLESFPEALPKFGQGVWRDFYEVCNDRSSISIHRPFYPNKPGGKRLDHLVAGLDFESRDELLRVCEIGVPDRPAACSLFWTLGAKQVGKAAITGWKEILNPATQRGALLWPFGGPLDELIKRKQLIIAETYPAEAYRHIGVKFRSSSKRSVEGRRQQYAVLCAWAKRSGVHFEPQCQVEIESGFERCGAQGEDAFDALIGLLGMIDVADGRRAEGAPTHLYVRNWEGWILGQVSTNY